MVALTNTDWIVVGLYFGICALVNLIIIFLRKTDTLNGYFLANRSLTWLFIGCSLFVSNIDSTLYYIDYASSKGIAAIVFEWHSIWGILFLCFFFSPVFIASGVSTLPEYIKRRFQSSWMGAYYALINLIASTCIRLPILVYATALFLHHVLGYDLYASLVVLVPVTVLYTVIGGFPSVIYTHSMQFVIVVVGGIMMAVYSLDEVGGLHQLWISFKNLAAIHNSSDYRNQTIGNSSLSGITYTNLTNMTTKKCLSGIDENWNHVFRPIDDEDYPWIGVVFSLPITCVWYWCATQENVQKILSSKSVNNNRVAGIFSATVRILPFFCMILPGMAARAIFKDNLDACLHEYECSSAALFQLFIHILPRGVKGLLIVVIVAGLMSTLSAILNSVSSLFTISIWKEIRSKASDRELMIVARLCVLITAGISFVWVPVCTGQYAHVLRYLRIAQSYLAASTCPILFMGVLSTKLTWKGATCGSVVSLCLTLVRFTCDVLYPAPKCGEVDTRPMFTRLHYMYYSIIITVANTICACVVSFLTQPIPLEMLGGLTWSTIDEPPSVDDLVDKYEVGGHDIGMQNVVYESSFMDKNEQNAQSELSSDELFRNRSRLKIILAWLCVAILLCILVSFFIVFSIV